MSDGSNQTAAYHVLVQRNRFIDEEGMECAATGVQCHARLYFVRKKKKENSAISLSPSKTEPSKLFLSCPEKEIIHIHRISGLK